MSRPWHLRARWSLLLLTCTLLLAQAACSRPSGRPQNSKGNLPDSQATAVTKGPLSPAAGPGLEQTHGTEVGAVPPVGSEMDLPYTSFRYEIKLSPPAGLVFAGQGTGQLVTIITGQYGNGAWQQTEQTGDTPAQELLVSNGKTYTRPVGQPTWVRWSEVEFDAAYGLASPFTVLRLHRLAGQTARGELEPVPGASEPTFRARVSFPMEVIAGQLEAGVLIVAPDDETQAAMLEQISPMVTGQTLTYWVGESGKVYKAAATLLAADGEGQPAPWLEVTWRFWHHNDPGIVIQEPADFTEAPEVTMDDLPTPGASIGGPGARSEGAPASLIVRVYAWPGQPADDLAVTVYQVGKMEQPLDWRAEADAQFALPPGQYDVRVQMNYAEEWLRRVEIKPDGVMTREVVFDFGVLEIVALRDGEPAPVDIVTYPAGNREDWVDWRSDNPARIQLRAGTYDVEVAYGDGKTAEQKGLVVRAGKTTTQTITLKP